MPNGVTFENVGGGGGTMTPLPNTKIYVGDASNVAQPQTLSLSATGGTFALANTGVLTMPNADTTTRGLLTAADWNTFNGKLSSTLTDTNIFVGNGSNVATGVSLTLNATGGAFALANTGVLTMPNADATTRGLLTSADWSTFNGKQSAIPDWTTGFGSGTQATSTWSSTNAAANVNAAIIPKGTGAILVDLPDGTATGGNARGASAVDLQHVRSAATQVASGANSTISGGLNNSALAVRGVVGGGTNNTITAGDTSVISGGSGNTINVAANGLAVIGGGVTNSTTGAYSSIGGGDSNSVSGSYTAISGGQSNSTGSALNAYIGGGFSNALFNNYGVICGGYDNTNVASAGFVGGGETNNLSSGSYATLVGGQQNQVSANWGFLGGGYLNQLNEQFTSISGGRQANAFLYGMQAYSAGQFSALADAQAATIQMRAAITGTAITDLFLDGSSVRPILPATNALWAVRVQLAAICTAAGNGTVVTGASYAAERQCAIKRLNTTTSLVGAVQTIGANLSDTSMSTAAVTITADDTNEALRVQFTPPSTAGTTSTFRVVATIQLTQIKY